VLGEVLTAIVTPFKADGEVDYEKFRELAGYLLEPERTPFTKLPQIGSEPAPPDGRSYRQGCSPPVLNDDRVRLGRQGRRRPTLTIPLHSTLMGSHLQSRRADIHYALA